MKITIDLKSHNGCAYNYGGYCLLAKKLRGTLFCSVENVDECGYMRNWKEI